MKAITKTAFVGLCLIGTALTASAQFEIHSNGNMSFQRTGSDAPYCPISLKGGGTDYEAPFYISYSGSKNGIISATSHAQPREDENEGYGGLFLCNGNNVQTLVGLRGFGGSPAPNFPANQPGCIGVWGDCFPQYTSRYGLGVVGTVSGTYNGAGVFGTSSSKVPTTSVPDDKYAGLFVGKTKVVGNLFVTETIHGVLASPSSPESGGTQRAMSGEAMSDRMQGLGTIAYYHPQEEPEMIHLDFMRPDKEQLAEMERMGIDPAELDKPEEDVMARQVREKEHYALSVDELEKTFPNLVYTDKDGNKSVNYVEMVPLLVQCINELNARLSALDGGTGAGNVGADPVPARDDTAAARASQGDVSAMEGTSAKTNAMLYQNTPNPFTAQTEIRFSLPDDAPQAYIYIFDMTGKMQKQIPVDPDQQSVTINGYELQAGIYLYSLVVGGQEIDTKRMILSK